MYNYKSSLTLIFLALLAACGKKNHTFLHPAGGQSNVVSVLHTAKHAYGMSEIGDFGRLDLLVEPGGRPWILNSVNNLLLDAFEAKIYPLTPPLVSIAWLPDGNIQACLKGTKAEFGSVKFTDDRSGVVYQKTAEFPAFREAPKCRIFPGGESGTAYMVLSDIAKNSETIFLIRNGKASQLATITPPKYGITHVAGYGKDTFFSFFLDTEVQRLDKDGYHAYFNAEEEVTGLAYSKESGLFVSTSERIGYVDEKVRVPILTAKNPLIYMSGDELFVFQDGTLFKITHLSEYKNNVWPAQLLPKWGRSPAS